MILGSGSHQAGRRRFLLQAAAGAAVMLLGAVTLSGCGGGGGDDDTPNPTPSTSTVATVRGRLIENNTAELISNATVTFGTQTFVTGTDGQFSFQVPNGTGATKLTVTPPQGQYSTIGYINGIQVNLVNTGTTIPASSLTAGQTVNVGDIKLFSSDGPPPPPVF